MRRRLLTLLGVALTAGCATGRQIGPPAEDFAGPSGLELIVQNQGTSTVTAYVAWRGSREVRLGEVRSGRTETFNTPMRGREVRVTFGSPGRSGGRAGTDFVIVSSGDRMEWRYTATAVFFQRLPPR